MFVPLTLIIPTMISSWTIFNVIKLQKIEYIPKIIKLSMVEIKSIIKSTYDILPFLF
jgi:hypothetical protein